MRLFYIAFLLLLSSFKISDKNNHPQNKLPFPRIWTSYGVVKNYDEDFVDLKKHGVGAVVIGGSSPEVLKAARRHGMKIMMVIGDITEAAYQIDSSKVERAVMLGGAFNGKAIDRFRFAFAARPQNIIIENPVYDTVNCYGKNLGHYFPGMKGPVRAEVIVKEADFDSRPHLKIIPATTKRIDEHHWNMQFDLTGVNGDLDNVVLAVYWISTGKSASIFGDNASPFAESTREALKLAVREEVKKWADANGGTFPADVIVAACYGDECWNISGHLNCQACSYPMWDYSDAALKSFEKNYPGQVCPRGKSWPDMFGRQAYAGWLYNYHKACASLAGEVKQTLKDLDLNILTYRNLTRSNVFAVQNDQDGTGLELLVSKFDITLCDPYPVTPHGYCKDTIPSDMNYIAGLSRRYHTYLVPWMQAHQYLPEMGYLVHPKVSDIEKIINQHKQFQPDAAMWLGYGPDNTFYTFPNVNPRAWDKAGEIQMSLFEHTNKIKPAFAAIRPYNVRALRDVDLRQPQDHYFTDFLFYVSSDTLLFYDPYEPLTLSQLNTEGLKDYPVIIAEAGDLSKRELAGLFNLNKKVVFYIEGSDHFNIDSKITGIKSFKGKINSPVKIKLDEKILEISSLDDYVLDKNAEVLLKADDHPVIWKVGNKIFIAGSSVKGGKAFYGYWLKLMKNQM